MISILLFTIVAIVEEVLFRGYILKNLMSSFNKYIALFFSSILFSLLYSFYIDNLHFNLAVQLLNDKYGIQVRGGCSCAGTYGHILLNVQPDQSCDITTKINEGNLTSKPGWVRMSIHPTF